MAKCWETRGCEGQDMQDCPHDTAGLCPRSCLKSVCDKPQYERAGGMEMFEAADVDFFAARKENCHSCRFFLAHAPRVRDERV